MGWQIIYRIGSRGMRGFQTNKLARVQLSVRRRVELLVDYGIKGLSPFQS